MNILALIQNDLGHLIRNPPKIWSLINDSVYHLVNNSIRGNNFRIFRTAIRDSAWNSQCNSKQKQSILKELTK